MQLQLTVPPGVSAGQEMRFQTPSGQVMSVRVPPGVPPGASFVLTVPDQQPVAPPMGTPIAPSMATPRSAAAKFAECPISFEPLHAAPVGVFLDRAKNRVSGHYFNLAAAREWLSSGNGQCPMTRKPIASVLPIPDVSTDPNGWFSAVDLNLDNHLTRFEAIEAIKAQYPVDVAALDAAIADPNHWMWQQWDVDGSGTLERNELLAPQGLVASVQQLFPASGGGGGAPPEISNKLAWFDFWDSPNGGGDGSGALDKEEVLRGLLKTLRLTSDPSRVQQMRSTLDAIWGVFDTDGSGTIERGEFLQADGLADTIIATVAQG